MLSQEELDKLLEGDGDEESGSQENAETDNKAGAETGPVSQDDIDALLSGSPDNDGADTGSDEAAGSSDDSSDDAGTDDLDWGDAFAEAAAGGDSAAAKAMNEGVVDEVNDAQQAESASPPKPEAPAATFNNFSMDSEGVREGANLDFILEIPLEVSVELGRSKMQIKDLLQLGQGSVVELNKVAGEPADIYVNQKLLAKGEIVVMNEKFGVKLTEIISPADRVKSLG